MTERVVIRTSENRVVIREPMTRTVVARTGMRGPAGPAGDGTGGTLSAPAGEAIHAGRAVRLEGGLLYHPDPSVAAHAGQVIGIATTAAAPGASVTVSLAGTVTDSGWSFSDGLVWCGANGAPTQSPSGSGWLMPLGSALAADTLDLRINNFFQRI